MAAFGTTGLALPALAEQPAVEVAPAPAPPDNAHHHGPLLGSGVVASGDLTSLFRQPPSLGARLRVSGQTLLPYVGLGFNAGETSDLGRMVIRESTINQSHQQDRLRDTVSRGLMPSEVQVGVRILF